MGKGFATSMQVKINVPEYVLSQPFLWELLTLTNVLLNLFELKIIHTEFTNPKLPRQRQFLCEKLVRVEATSALTSELFKQIHLTAIVRS